MVTDETEKHINHLLDVSQLEKRRGIEVHRHTKDNGGILPNHNVSFPYGIEILSHQTSVSDMAPVARGKFQACKGVAYGAPLRPTAPDDNTVVITMRRED